MTHLSVGIIIVTINCPSLVHASKMQKFDISSKFDELRIQEMNFVPLSDMTLPSLN